MEGSNQFNSCPLDNTKSLIMVAQVFMGQQTTVGKSQYYNKRLFS